ncbi:Gmad2 immunoglobulin-like domain-containing protein [Nocardioides piscis]|uniref:GerMN domain-containing protein n=1 Tax=Nocardioides piscis TaxID=2714938 RepID=A0A6G7YH51_9ACTN|nr:Gmad2 immunoglobulin-like domain-containing protein [Nocardioides piscis]QIK75996.1 hypothetical protein G7071_11660 [Nocardioides piscis]
MTSPSATLRRRLATALSLGVVLTSLAACSDEVTPDPDPSPAGETTSPSPDDETGAASEEPQPSEPSPDDAAEQVTVPLYFVGDTTRGPRLFREFRSVPSDNPLQEATAMLVAGDTLDPDYRTLWPAMELSVSATDGVLLVQVAGDGFTERPDGMSKRSARLAIQQLVYTLQGVQQERVPVQFARAGTDARLFGLSTESPYTNDKQLRVSSLVNITSPEQGSTVSDDELAISGVASTYEATVPWEILRGEEVVLDGFVTAEGWMGKLYPWEGTIDISDLEAGDYTFLARTADPSGGTEGSGPDEDTKDFTVE